MSERVSSLLIFGWVLLTSLGCAQAGKPALEDVASSMHQVGRKWT
jgi:hypothetical protein